MKAVPTHPAIHTNHAVPTRSSSGFRRIAGILTGLIVITGLGLAVPGTAEARSSSRSFSVSASPQTISLVPGNSASFRVGVFRGSRFRSALRYQVDNPFIGVSVGATASASSSIDFKITTASTTPTQIGQIRVRVSGGGITRIAAVTLQIQGAPTPPPPPPPPPTQPQPTVPAPVGDFALAVDPTAFTISTGGSATLGVFVSPANGYSGSPRFDLVGLPAGVIANFVNPTSRTGTNLLLTVASNAPRGVYPLTIRGIDGDKVRTAATVMTIQFVGDFGLSASFDPGRAAPGSTATLKVQVGAASGQTQVPDVELSLNGFPPGTNVSPAVIKTNTTATFNLTLPVGLAEGTYGINVRGTSGTITRTSTATLIISAKPLVSLTPASISIAQGGQATFEIVYTPVAGIVTPALSLPTVPAGLGANIINNVADGKRFLVVTSTTSTAKGTYTVGLSATSGTAVTNVTVVVVVT
jgi:hypothetical protein